VTPNTRAASLISRAAKFERSHEIDAFARMYAAGAFGNHMAMVLCARFARLAMSPKAKEYLGRAGIELY
jgi:hypothetical protein